MIGVEEIKRVIPHRPPVLALDWVSRIDPGKSLVAHGTIADTCPIGKLLESWAQAAVLLVRWDNPNPDVRTGDVELLTGIRKVDVLGPVHPGDVVEHRVEVVRAVDDAAVLTGSTLVDGRPVLRIGSLTVAHRPIDALQETT